MNLFFFLAVITVTIPALTILIIILIIWAYDKSDGGM